MVFFAFGDFILAPTEPIGKAKGSHDLHLQMPSTFSIKNGYGKCFAISLIIPVDKKEAIMIQIGVVTVSRLETDNWIYIGSLFCRWETEK